MGCSAERLLLVVDDAQLVDKDGYVPDALVRGVAEGCSVVGGKRMGNAVIGMHTM